MAIDRRDFLKAVGLVAVGESVVSAARGSLNRTSFAVGDSEGGGSTDRRMGVLVDLPHCIGCRKCEFACQEAAGFHPPPIDRFDDKSVFAVRRRPGPRSYTTVNEFPGRNGSRTAGGNGKPVYMKANCLHCNEPACVSACLVGALRKQPNGAVTYDAATCMGCRYCMVACPFQIPAYDYDDAFAPQVRKCDFCFERIKYNGAGPAVGNVPACVKVCPNDALTFGRRGELLNLAHEKIRARPDLYVDHVYGEKEAGGTSWLYLSSVPFEQLDLPTLGSQPPSRLTEAIQHGVFKFFVPPLALYALLGIIMRLSRNAERKEGIPC